MSGSVSSLLRELKTEGQKIIRSLNMAKCLQMTLCYMNWENVTLHIVYYIDADHRKSKNKSKENWKFGFKQNGFIIGSLFHICRSCSSSYKDALANSFDFCAVADTCYVLSFAIIMLNTSLHNPNVRDKPPVERFISMNRGINEGGDLPEELLRVRIFL